MADAGDVSVHPLADDVLEQPAFEALHVDTMAGVELVGAVKHAEVLVDAILLNEGVTAVPVDWWTLQVWRGRAVAAECAAVPGEAQLQRPQVGLVQDEAFQPGPAFTCPDLDPAVDDVARRQPVSQPGDRAALQLLVNGEAMEAAGNAQRA